MLHNNMTFIFDHQLSSLNATVSIKIGLTGKETRVVRQ